jgi:hypothetical protein
MEYWIAYFVIGLACGVYARLRSGIPASLLVYVLCIFFWPLYFALVLLNGVLNLVTLLMKVRI